MSKFRITYGSNYGDPEDVEADDFIDEQDGKWITFRRIRDNGKTDKVLRIQAGSVVRIDRIAD